MWIISLYSKVLTIFACIHLSPYMTWFIFLWCDHLYISYYISVEKRFPAYVRPNRATASLLLPAQTTLHLLLRSPSAKRTLLGTACSSVFLLFPRRCFSEKSIISDCSYHTLNPIDFSVFCFCCFFMERHSLGMFDNKRAGVRRNINSDWTWNNNNLQVRWFILMGNN